MKLSFFIFLFIMLIIPSARADGDVVDKVYSPYVLPFERELEWRFMSRQNDDGNELTQRFAYGHALSEFITMETYIIAARDSHGDFGLKAYEVEARWMMTEQGQFWADWGMLFEVEKQHELNIWEVSTGVLMEKEFGKVSFTANMFIVYESGSDIQDEFEFETRMKLRYRWLPQLQPAIEFYSGEDFVGVGPAVMGIQRYQGQKQLKWEMAFITGLNGNNKDHSLRFALEYEF
ncbi:hypothetical protein QX776_11545 [Alteromonadaceae bacterium BrNp21-10]|nr:hypothetical protein [Alteromonadaceae bacterium BrNp21-10]